MKPHFIIPALIALAHSIFAGESSLTVTFQPLDGLGSGEITISPVACHDWYSHSGQITAIGLISAPNIPPTNNPKEATENLNLASVCGVRFSSGDVGDSEAAIELTMDATKFQVSAARGFPREAIIRACLECLRRCLPDKLRGAPLALRSSDADKLWMMEIVRQFNAHDRSKEFHSSPQ